MISCEGSRSDEQLTVSWPRLADMTLLISIPECGDWLTQYTDNTEVARYATCVDIGHYTSLCSNLTDIDVQYHLCFVNRSVCTLQHLTKYVWFWNLLICNVLILVVMNEICWMRKRSEHLITWNVERKLFVELYVCVCVAI